MSKNKPNRYREEEKELEESGELEEINESPDSSCDIEALKEEAKKYKEQYLRVLADSENFKKRIDEERIRDRKYSSQRLLEKIIPSIDIFDKALNMKTDDEKLNNFLIGFEMINNNLKQALEEEGVKKIKAVGEKFDPKFHHAVETEWDERYDEGIVLSEMQTGYMYKDRVLRPSLVKVNKKEEAKEPENNIE